MELSISRYKERHWAIYTQNTEHDRELVCVCVYKKGARNVVRLMEAKRPLSFSQAEVQGSHLQDEPPEEKER